ncbi:hypothetical protein OYC64_021026 [Pagothenia borchgrevinki]|uniref:POF1B helix-loop-helix domain-containing protein n=1 Tax=Pagothenia borchgrevinki TaxID=8213 RepID=A0ABD2FNK9_PAGBO
MSMHSTQKTTTYRTVKVAASSPEPVVSNTVISSSPVSPVPYGMNGSYETVRYLMPMQQGMQQQQSYIPVQQQQQQSYIPVQQQQQQSYIPVQQGMVQQGMQQQYIIMQQPMMQQQQPMMQQMVSPVYMQGMSNLSVSSQDTTDHMYLQNSRHESISGMSSSVFSVEEEEEEEVAEEEEEEEEEQEEEEERVEIDEVEIINVVHSAPPVIKTRRTEVRTEVREMPTETKMDTRYFGELLAEVYRKNCDIHSCISEHVSKIRGQKHHLDPSNDYKVEKEEVEALLPKGASELTRQQIRYLLQTRLTADKSMRLLLSTFSSLREELLHMTEDMMRLESEKEGLERDLSFKSDQALQYDSLLEAVRDNNRQLQLSLKETSSTQRSLESQLMSTKSSDSSRDFRLKEMEGRMRAMEKENEMLRQKLAGQASSSTLHVKTEELSRQYKDQLSAMRDEKDQEIQRLRSQVTRIQTEITTTSERSSSDKSLQLKISELLAMLELRQTTISKQEEEIRRMRVEMTSMTTSSSNTSNSSSSRNLVTKTTTTQRFSNKYPMLGLLDDQYQSSSVKTNKTIVLERTT